MIPCNNHESFMLTIINLMTHNDVKLHHTSYAKKDPQIASFPPYITPRDNSL